MGSPPPFGQRPKEPTQRFSSTQLYLNVGAGFSVLLSSGKTVQAQPVQSQENAYFICCLCYCAIMQKWMHKTSSLVTNFQLFARDIEILDLIITWIQKASRRVGAYCCCPNTCIQCNYSRNNQRHRKRHWLFCTSKVTIFFLFCASFTSAASVLWARI